MSNTTYTYICTDASGYYKIGKAVNLKRRWREFRCANPTIYIYAYHIGDIEKELHKKYEKYNIGGEWFSLTDCQLQSIVFNYKFNIV